MLAVRYQYSRCTYMMTVLNEQHVHIYRRLTDSTADGVYRSISRTNMKQCLLEESKLRTFILAPKGKPISIK
jgi:hypothetical protein